MNWIKKIKCKIGLCFEQNLEEEFSDDRIKEILLSNPAVGGNFNILLDILANGELTRFTYGEKIIEQGATDDNVYFFLSGEAYVIVNKEKRAIRQSPNQVGEMVALDPAKPRSATVQVNSDYVVAWRISGQDFRVIKEKYPEFANRLQIEMNCRFREQLAASRIAKENNSTKWFFISIATSAVISILSWLLLQRTDWSTDVHLIISGCVFIFSFLVMMLNNPAFFLEKSIWNYTMFIDCKYYPEPIHSIGFKWKLRNITSSLQSQ